MLDVFNFATCTEHVLFDVFTKQGVMQAATICPNSSMEYLFVWVLLNALLMSQKTTKSSTPSSNTFEDIL